MSETNESEDRELSFLEHLVELRSRLLKACVAVLLVLLVLLPFSRKLYALLAAPLTAVLPEGSSMIAIDVASPFLTPFKLALLLALIISIPVVLYQLWDRIPLSFDLQIVCRRFNFLSIKNNFSYQ